MSLRSIPGIGPLSAAMLIAEMPELGKMTAGEAAAYHNPVLKLAAQRLKERGKPHKFAIVAVARRLVTIANAILKSGALWSHQSPT